MSTPVFMTDSLICRELSASLNLQAFITSNITAQHIMCLCRFLYASLLPVEAASHLQPARVGWQMEMQAFPLALCLRD